MRLLERSSRSLALARAVARRVGCVLVVASAPACATRDPGATAPSVSPAASARSEAAAPRPDPRALLAKAEAALADDAPARAAALFGRYLAEAALDDPGLEQAYLGLARAHEQLRDCPAAVRTYGAYLERFPRTPERPAVLVRRGACEAEMESWEASARTFAEVAALDDLLASLRVEALARRGYALFMLDRLEEADAALAEADAVFERAQAENLERFGSYYFVGMARFYRAAVVHRKFRDVEIRLPEKVMEAAFKKKLELLMAAQDAYNHTIRAKHMFWVSAAGYQLGHLFGEFYDAMMYAPVPDWLDDRQRKIYYEELKKQLRPVIEKAVWVFEKNLEAARRLGYESPFVEQTQAKLGHLQAVMLSDDATLGRPHPRLAAENGAELEPPDSGEGGEGEGASSAADRKLFVPRPTPL